MPKKMRKARGRDTLKAARVIKTAEITGLSKRQINRVIEGDQKNDSVIDVYMKIEEGDNLLIEAIKKAVPFN